MTCYSKCTEAAEIAASIIPEHHPDLAAADVKLLFLFRDKAAKAGGKIVLGKAAKRAARDRFLSRIISDEQVIDAIIEIAEDKWTALKPEQRRALVDHELCHLEVAKTIEKIQVDEEEHTITRGPRKGQVKIVPIFEEREVADKNDDGRPKLKLKAHDIEEFGAVLKRHGFWKPDLLESAEALREADDKLQGRLFGDPDATVLSRRRVRGDDEAGEDLSEMTASALAQLAESVVTEMQERTGVDAASHFAAAFTALMAGREKSPAGDKVPPPELTKKAGRRGTQSGAEASVKG